MKKILLIILGVSTLALADLIPKTYWELEIAIRTLTIEGMQQRVKCLHQEECSLDKQMKLSSKYQEKIYKVFQDYNTTPSKELVYENKNRKIIEQYLQENEDISKKVDELKAQFENYSNQITEIMEAR